MLLSIDPFALSFSPLLKNQSLFLPPENLDLHPSLPLYLLHRSLRHIVVHRSRTTQVFILYFAVHVSVPAGAADSRLRVLFAAPPHVSRPRLLHRLWAKLQVLGPGPGIGGLRCWAALLRDGVSQGGLAATAKDELEDPRDLCHVFSSHFPSCQS